MGAKTSEGRLKIYSDVVLRSVSKRATICITLSKRKSGAVLVCDTSLKVRDLRIGMDGGCVNIILDGDITVMRVDGTVTGIRILNGEPKTPAFEAYIEETGQDWLLEARDAVMKAWDNAMLAYDNIRAFLKDNRDLLDP